MKLPGIPKQKLKMLEFPTNKPYLLLFSCVVMEWASNQKSSDICIWALWKHQYGHKMVYKIIKELGVHALRIVSCRKQPFCSRPGWPCFKNKLKLKELELQMARELSSVLVNWPKRRGTGPCAVSTPSEWWRAFLSQVHRLYLLRIFCVFCSSFFLRGRGSGLYLSGGQVYSLKLSRELECLPNPILKSLEFVFKNLYGAPL